MSAITLFRSAVEKKISENRKELVRLNVHCDILSKKIYNIENCLWMFTPKQYKENQSEYTELRTKHNDLERELFDRERQKSKVKLKIIEYELKIGGFGA